MVFSFLVLAILLLACAPKIPRVPTVFIKEQNNPILEPTVGAWDELNLGIGSVIKVDSTYYLYYAGVASGRGDAHIGIATASSLCGPWRKYKGNPIVAPGADGNWDDYAIYQARVHKFGSTYYMWYIANQEIWRGGHFPWRIGLATATAPEGPWTKYEGNPILNVGKIGDWDGIGLNLGAITEVEGTYWMWYAGFKEHPDEYGQIGFAKASSPKGPWKEYNGNPVFSPRSWNSFGSQEPFVLYINGYFHMWYAGMPVIGDARYADIGYAYSDDGIHWTDYPDNPVLSRGKSGKWDDYDVSEPFVFVEGGSFYLFHTGFRYPTFDSAIGLAIGRL